MEEQKINALELVRTIRDKHYQQLIGKSDKERIDFYQKQAQNMFYKVSSLLQDQKNHDSSETQK